MSLINQMLRDLDKRDANGQARPIITPEPVPLSHSTDGGRRRLIWLLLPVLAAVAVVGYFQWPLEPSASVVTDVSAVPDSVPIVRASASREIPVAESVVSVAQGSPQVEAVLQPSPGKTEPVVASVEVTEKQPHVVESDIAMPVVSVEPVSPPHKTLPAGPSETRLPKPTSPVNLPMPPQPMAPDNTLSERTAASELRPQVKPNAGPSISGNAVPTNVVQVTKVTPEAVRDSADTVYRTALMQLNEGQLQEAEASLRHTLTLDRSHIEARRLLAMLLLNKGEQGEAALLLDEGLRLVPDAVPLVILRGRLALEREDYSTAVRLLERQRAASGDDNELLSLLASAYQQTRQFGEAAALYRQIVVQQPGNARALAGLAISLDATGAYSEALSRYREALAADSLPSEVNEYARQRVSVLSVER